MKTGLKKLTSVIAVLAMTLGLTVRAEQTENDVKDLSLASGWKWEEQNSGIKGTITEMTEGDTDFMRVSFPQTSYGVYLWDMQYIRNALGTPIKFDPAKQIEIKTRVRVGEVGTGRNIQLRYNLPSKYGNITGVTATCSDGVTRKFTWGDHVDRGYLTLWEMGTSSTSGKFKVINGMTTEGTGKDDWQYTAKLTSTDMAVSANTWFEITTVMNNNGYVDFLIKNETTGEEIEMTEMPLNFFYGDSLSSLAFMAAPSTTGTSGKGSIPQFDVDYVTVREIEKNNGDEEYYSENFVDFASKWTNETGFDSAYKMSIEYGRDLENKYMTVSAPKIYDEFIWGEPYIRLELPGTYGKGIDLTGEKTIKVKSKIRIKELGGKFELKYNLPEKWTGLKGTAMTDDNGYYYCGKTEWSDGQTEQNAAALWYVDASGKLFVPNGSYAESWGYMRGKYSDTGIVLGLNKWYTVETYFNNNKNVTIAFYDENGNRSVFSNKDLSFIKGTTLSSLEFYESGAKGSTVDITDIEITGGEKLSSNVGVYLEDTFDGTNGWTIAKNTTPLASAVNNDGYMTLSTAEKRSYLKERQLWMMPYIRKTISGEFGGGIEFSKNNDILIRTRLQKKELNENDLQLRYNVPSSDWQKYQNTTVKGADGAEYTYSHNYNNGNNNIQQDRGSLALWRVESDGKLYVTDGITTDTDAMKTEYKTTNYAVSDLILNDTDWYTIDTLLHGDGTVSVKVTNERTGAADALVNKKIGFTLGNALGSIEYLTNASFPEINIDDVKVENIKKGSYVMGKNRISVEADGSAEYTVYGDYDKNSDVKIIRAMYSTDGALLDVESDVKTAVKNQANEFTMDSYEDEIPEGAYFKVFLWKGEQTPLLKAESSPGVYAAESIIDENGNYLSDEDGELRIAYIGGSITAGDSDFEGTGLAEDSIWVNRVSNYFAEQFPNKTIKTYNAGLGGTNSNYGSVRFQDHVLDYIPDIVFMEFTVNDSASTISESYQQTYIERMIRMCQKAQKIPVFVYVHVQKPIDESSSDYEDYMKCIEYKNELTEYYGIKTINLYDALKADFAASGVADFMSYIAKYYNSNGANSYDVHPKTTGHKFMADAIINAIESDKLGTFAKINDVAPLTGGLAEPQYNFIGADDERITYSDGFTVYTASNKYSTSVSAEKIPDSQYVYPSFPGGIAQTKNVDGAELTFKTRADSISMSYISSTVGNSAKVYVDGVEKGTLSCDDPSYNGMNYRSGSVTIADDGQEHEVKIVVNDVTSDSYIFRFGAIIECFN